MSWCQVEASASWAPSDCCPLDRCSSHCRSEGGLSTESAKKGIIQRMISKNYQKHFCAALWFQDDSEDGKEVFHKRTWSLFEGTTVDTEGGTLVEEGVEEPRRAELATWTTLVTVMVCLILFAADCLVTTVPSDGNWFSWFKTNVVVDGWGLCCWRH